jgi:hypothetical protein
MKQLRRRIQTAMQQGGGAAASFNPTTVSGMAAWWAARKESFANNDPVGTATDWTGNGLSLTQSTASKKPLFLTGQKNGLPAFSGDGVDDFLTGGDILDIGTGSIHFFLVAKYDSVATAAIMMAKSLQAGFPNRYSAVGVVGGQWFGLLKDTVGVNPDLQAGTPDTNWHLFEFIVDRVAGSYSIWVDGVQIDSDTGIAAGDINSTFRFLLFAYNNATDTGEVLFMSGKIAEVWCWQRVLTAGERTTLRAGANSLYSIY